MKEVLLTPEEIAKKLNLTAKTIRTWIIEGRLVGFARGGRWLVPKKEFDKYLREERK